MHISNRHPAHAVLCAQLFLVLALSAPSIHAKPNAPQTADIEAAAQAIGEAVREVHRVPGAFPAVSAVVVHGEETPLLLAQGALHADDGGAADASSRFYIASQTKSFVGLLAAELDAQGVLPLSTTLAEVWPALRLPAPAEPARITLADLLSHQAPLRTDTLNLLSAYVRELPAADYPALLAEHTQAREPGFRYANLGYLIYGAALETRTGAAWQTQLRQQVLQPLQLRYVHARSSEVAPDALAWNHQWDGQRWLATPPKPDGLMHAAGGLYASSADMARWLRANLRLRSPSGRPSLASFERAQRPVVEANLSDREFICDGYSLGWYACGYRGHRVLMHPGSYRGAVSVSLLLPDLGAGLSFAVNSDSAIEGFALELMKAFIGLAHGDESEHARLRQAVADYPARLARMVESRREAVANARADPSWGGWAWKPTREELQAYVGEFESERLGRMSVRLGRDGLEARLGAMRMQLMPAREGVFGARGSEIEAPEAFHYTEDRARLSWKGASFRARPQSGLARSRMGRLRLPKGRRRPRRRRIETFAP